MSVEGVPSVDDVADLIGTFAGVDGAVHDGEGLAAAVHALYAPVLADASRYREALETVRAVGNRAAVQVADAALAEGSGGTER